LADLGREGHYVDRHPIFGSALASVVTLPPQERPTDRRAILPFQRPTSRCDVVAERGRRVLSDADGIVVGCGIKRSY
jgi:hypothetical protein